MPGIDMIYIYMLPPPCAYIFLSLQEDTYKKTDFLGQEANFPTFQFSGPNFPFFQFSKSSGPNFPFFQFSNVSGPDFGMLESWKVRSRKLENWKMAS